MFAWINLAMLLAASILFLLFYVRSVSPAGREMIIGPRAFRFCFYDRMISAIFELIITANFILYYFFPLPTLFPNRFPFSWWISIGIAAIIGIPAIILMITGIKAAGGETMRPQPDQTMYRGIYKKIRHPQAVGEVFLFPVIAILLHSPFLTLFSLIFFPIFIIMCHAEEQDLLLRYGEAYAEYCRNTGTFWPKKRKGNA